MDYPAVKLAHELCGNDIDLEIAFKPCGWPTEMTGELRQIYMTGSEIFINILQTTEEVGDYPHREGSSDPIRIWFVEYRVDWDDQVVLQEIQVDHELVSEDWDLHEKE